MSIPLHRAGTPRVGSPAEQDYLAVPKQMRRDLEFAIRKEERALDRARSISMDR